MMPTGSPGPEELIGSAQTALWLRSSLIAPDGTNYLLKAANSADTAANVVETYTVNASNEALNGTWKLRVTDQTTGQSGTLNSWTLRF